MLQPSPPLLWAPPEEEEEEPSLWWGAGFQGGKLSQEFLLT